MSRRQACANCHELEHHRPDCSEMFFPSGRRRDDPGPMPALGPLEPDKALPLHFESPLGESMSRIFSGLTERMIERYIEAVRAQREAAS